MDIDGLRIQWAKKLGLTKREIEVLEHVIRGKTTKEVAAELGISPSTVEVHREHIRMKVGARNTADLLRIVLVD